VHPAPEMKRFDFYTSWGHGDFKTFVEDYAQKMQARHNAQPAAPAAKAIAAHAGSAESIFSGRH